MATSTICIDIGELNEAWDASRLSVVLEEIKTSLREEAGIPAELGADSMTIAIEVASDRLVDAVAVLRELELI